ncbi:MAG: hypothetical protein IJY42_00020 [Clostridia bacterium]|nr:hypothetical protein [Clostridia bacterium]
MAKEGLNESAANVIQRRAWVWIMLMVTIIMIVVLLTIGIISLRVGNYLPEGTDILFIVGKNPEVVTGEAPDKAWEAGRDVNIFSSSYQNGQGQTTILSGDGVSVVAPGFVSKYKFGMYNNGNMAVVYETDLDFTFRINGKVQKEYNFPMEVRLKDSQGRYLIGGEEQWVNVDRARLSRHVSLLGRSSYEEFELELRWLFDGGDDVLDTLYGNLATKGEGVSLTLGINTYAEEHLEPEAKGGTMVEGTADGETEAGGTMRWVWVVVLMVCGGILIFYVAWLLNKRMWSK